MKTFFASIFCLVNLACFSQVTPTFNDIQIPMRDGEFLEADVYIPAGVDSCQIILIQTPYNKDLFQLSLPLGIGTNLDGQPFGFVIVDWRGFYGSSGANLSNFTRGEDGYDVIQWITEQVWHLDRVGTWGPSALGGVQYNTAREQHPNHTCAVPLVAHPQQSYDSYFYGGVLEEARLEQLDALGYGLSPIVLANPYYSFTWQFAEADSWYPSDIQIPTLQIGGWYDHNIDKMIDWYEATRNQVPLAVQDEQWLLVGPWVHGGTGIAYVGSATQGELSYPNAAGWSNSMALDFFNYYLLDSNNNWQATGKITYYQLGLNVWNTTNAATIDLPLNDVLYLNAGDQLQLSTSFGSTSYVSDPANPVPTIGGANLNDNLDQGPYDQTTLSSRNDVISFQSDVLYANATISGRVVAELFVESDQPDCDMMVHLIDVYPDGREMLITDGARRMRFRNGYTQADETFMNPGQVYPVEITLPFTNYTWEPGHRIKINIASTSSSRWNVNLQDGGTMYQPGTGNLATISVHHSTTYPSKITLPGTNSSLGTEKVKNDIVRIYPNPSDGIYTIDAPTSVSYDVFTINSTKVLSGTGNTVDLLAQPPGIYIISIRTENNTYHQQLVKQ